MVGNYYRMRRIFTYLLSLLLLNQVIFAIEGAKWIQSDLSDLTEAADSGDAYALGFLALCHLHGDKGLDVSHLEARFFAENSASRGHWLGNFVLGYLSRFQPIGPNSSQVAKFLLKSFRDPDGKLIKQAAVGDPVACYVLAEIFLSEEIQTVLQSDMKLAADYYDISSEAGYLPACVQSALIRIHGLKDALTKDKKSLKEGIELLSKGVDKKLPAAHHYLASCFLEGLGVVADKDLALVHFQASADRGYGPSMVMLADFHAYGYAGEPDEVLAFDYIQRAVDVFQEGAPQKIEEYKELFKRNNNQVEDVQTSHIANESIPEVPMPGIVTHNHYTDNLPGSPVKSFRLPSPYTSQDNASIIQSNEIVPQANVKERGSVEMEFSSADLKNSSVIQIRENAKKIYWGKSTDDKLNEASQSFEKCANLGDAESARYLGIMYLRGKGVVKDVKQAIKWLEIAAKGGDSLAEKNLSSLRKIMKM